MILSNRRSGSKLLIMSSIMCLTFSLGCSKKSQPAPEASQTSQSLTDDRLIELLDEARSVASDLSNLREPEATQIATGLLAALANLDRLILQERRLNQDPLVLVEIDYIVLGLSRAGDFNLQNQINIIKSQIAQLRIDLDALSADLAGFKTMVLARMDQADEVIRNIETNVNTIANRLSDHIVASEAGRAALQAALRDLQEFTQAEIRDIHRVNRELATQIAAQKDSLDELFSSQAAIANLQNKICTGTPANRCTPAQVSQMIAGQTVNCPCIAVEDIDCSVMFPSTAQSTAVNQCNMIIAVLKNHNEQLRLIREVDEKQNEMISAILDDVDTLNNQVGVLAQGFDQVNRAVQLLGNKVTELEARILIQELKSARAEGGASIFERADLNLAWITRRITDVRHRFCRENVQAALDKSDYEAARQNWEYCHERLSILARAQERTLIAKAYVNGALSTNMDQFCTAQVAGKRADDLTAAELLVPANFEAVKANCNHGQSLVLGSFLNAVALLNDIGPDFRTAEYMATKPKIGQILAFYGKELGQLTAQERAEFDNIDPTTQKLMNTAFGSIERAFKYNYVSKVLRTAALKFPRTADEMPRSSGTLHATFTNSEIRAGSTEYLQRLRLLEIADLCQDCGFRVTGRNPASDHNPQVDRAGKKLFSFPKDAEDNCLIENQHIVLRNDSDQAYYVYNLSYDSIWEVLRPALVGGNQIKIASNEEAVQSGLFDRCDFHAGRSISRNGMPDVNLYGRWIVRQTQPYQRTFPGARAQCVKYTAVCVPERGDWVAPNTSSTQINRFLSGFSTNTVQARCNAAAPGTRATKTNLSEAELEFLRFFDRSKTTPEARRTIAQAGEWSTGAFKANPLGDQYWVYRTAQADYGNRNHRVSRASSLYGVNGMGLDFLRPVQSASSIESVVKDECLVGN